MLRQSIDHRGVGPHCIIEVPFGWIQLKPERVTTTIHRIPENGDSCPELLKKWRQIEVSHDLELGTQTNGLLDE